MTKKYFVVLVTSLILSACSLFPTNQSKSPSPTPESLSPISASPSPAANTTPSSSSPIVGLKTSHGTIVIKLYAIEAPNTVRNFLTKVNSGFYNGLTFHRVISDFMAQGGDPKGDGTGGGQIKSEINTLPFKRGSLGLARSPGNKQVSNDSQFFICFTTEQCQHLTNDYVNFGEVVSGLDVLDQIKQGDKILQISQNTK